MLRDLQYAARTLGSSPAFGAAAVLTLALGVGASTAIFSVADAVLLRPLPYKDPGRLVYACADLVKRNVYDYLWSSANFFDLRDHASGAIEDAAAVRTGRLSLQLDDGSPLEVARAEVTPKLFRLLGLRIEQGRDFLSTDGQVQTVTDNGAPAPPDPRFPAYAIASHEFFVSRLGANPAALNRPMGKNGPILVGVLAPGAELLFRPDKNIEQWPDYYVAARLDPTEPRVSLSLRVIARLRPGVTVGRAQSQADAVSAQIRAIEPTYRGANLQFRIQPMERYLVSQVRPAILALMGAVIFLLLIACSNVANLFLVRASLRARDLAVRTALGASWWRLVRQTMAEALLVGALGSLLGFALAWAGIHNLLAIMPGNLPRAEAIRMNPTVMLFSIGAGLAAALLFGLAPSMRAARPDVAQVLRAAGRTAGLSGGSFARNSVVVAEVALCFVLLVGSGLMFRSFLALERIDTGFDPHDVLTFRSMGGRQQRTVEERAEYVRQMHDWLAAIRGVKSVTAASAIPLSGAFYPYRWGKEDALNDLSKFQSADVQTVLPGYFATMHTPIIMGREFNDSDNRPEVRRLVIDQAMAAKAFPGENPVGKRILMRFRLADSEWFEIIGVAAHQRFTSLADPGREQAYLPDGFWQYRFVTDWALRTEGDPSRYAAAVHDAMTRFDRSMLLTHVESMDSIVAHAQTSTRFSLLLIAAFASIAALLAAVGLYGVLSTVVRQRTAEIGVRMALGAAPTGVFRLMIGYGLGLSAVGIALGLAAALVATRAMTTMLIGIRPNDPATFAAMAALFLAIAALATGLPARRAAMLDPSVALRGE